MAQLLPDDVLEDILGRLPPRSLAACRCTCRSWRAAVDSRHLLPHAELLLPHTLGGIFYNLGDVECSRFLAHPSVRDAISGFLDYFTIDDEVRGHRNGLLLLDDSVANPATEQWAGLPPRPALYMGSKYYTCGSYLVYEPALSPHYEVVSIPSYHRPINAANGGVDRVLFHTPTCEESVVEWPQSQLNLLVFSSRTGQWEEMPFLPDQGQTTATWPAVTSICPLDQNYSVYWQEELYAYWKANYPIMRISLSTKTYRLIQLPTDEKTHHLYLGKSEKAGIYGAMITNYSRLRIWFLSVSFDQMEWVLKYDNHLKPTLPCFDYYDNFYDEQPNGPWTLQEEYYYEDCNTVAVNENQFEWDSDSDDILQVDETAQWRGSYSLLGFHPYKDVIFLEEKCGKALAFHWNISKFQHLGKLYAKKYRYQGVQLSITASFPYTPCWIDLFKGNSY